MEQVKFGVIVVSWNVCRQLRACLESLRREKNAGADLRVVVVDNNSSDGSAEMIKANFSEVNLIGLSVNVGFARACNLAALQLPFVDYYVFLNPDTQITTGFFSDLERAFLQRPQAGVIGGHIINPDGTTQLSVRRLPNLWVGLLEAVKLLGRFPWLASNYLQLKFDYNQSQPVEQVMGACFAVRNEVWRQLGGFDEKFFLWFEEVDFCHRARQAGYEVWYDHNISLLHEGSKSFSQLSASRRHYLYSRSLVYYLQKHFNFWYAGLVWLLSRPVFLVTYFYDHVFKKNQ